MENWQLALVVIAALLVGALLPAIAQYRSTMRSWEKVIRDNEPEIRRSIIEISQLSTRLNRIGSAVESNRERVESFFEAFEGVTEGVKRISGTVRTASVFGAAVAPAVTAAVRAIQNAQQASAHHAEVPQEHGNDLTPARDMRVERGSRPNGIEA